MEIIELNDFGLDSSTLPDEILNYNYILVFTDGLNANRNTYFYLIATNCGFDIHDLDGIFSITFESDDYIAFRRGRLSSDSNWGKYSHVNPINITPYKKEQAEYVMCSDNLVEYTTKSVFEFEFVVPETISSCVVSTSVKDIEFLNLFDEIISILPLVIVVLISFLSIKKGITFIKNLILKS